MNDTGPLLRVRDLSKSYGGVLAVADVSFDVAAGECVALLGGNGAGKSTVVAALTGLIKPDSGSILIDSLAVDLSGPQDAREVGIEAVFQNLALCDNLDAPANLFLGRELYRSLGPLRVRRDRRMRDATRVTLEQMGVRMPDLKVPVSSHSGGQRQALAFARAVRSASRLLILDEPTAALGLAEKRQVVAAVRRLIDERGMAVLLVSHDMHEMQQLADRVVVLRQGRLAASTMPPVNDLNAIVGLITGVAA